MKTMLNQTIEFLKRHYEYHRAAAARMSLMGQPGEAIYHRKMAIGARRTLRVVSRLAA